MKVPIYSKCVSDLCGSFKLEVAMHIYQYQLTISTFVYFCFVSDVLKKCNFDKTKNNSLTKNLSAK